MIIWPGENRIQWIPSVPKFTEERKNLMEDIHEIFTRFKEDFPQVHAKHEALGKEIHEKSGPLPEKSRWLIKIAISGTSGQERALETHIQKARTAGATEEEIKHVLLLLITTVGFPVFMRAYSVLKNTG
ncbi:MAG: carboxymuconolactone decarboxylase family protein [Proteobacteria bacterium]|nr:carboxymuconolactone decarboxylase family protein [Pseudomonadota bacterium]